MLLNSFLARGCDFLGSTYPIRCGAMTWVSGLELVSAVGNNGGFDLLAGGSLMAVQSVGLVTQIQPPKDIISEVVVEAEVECQ